MILSFLRRRWLRLVLLVVVIPIAVVLCALSDRKYYLSSTLVVLLTLCAFFLSFDRRSPPTRELVLLTVLCALSVAARVVVPLPNLKPTMALVLLAGIAFGGESGFLCGAMAALVSNFFFGQGPWTSWQMLAYGLGGLLAGLLTRCHLLTDEPKGLGGRLRLAVTGFFLILLVVGPVLDTSTWMTIYIHGSLAPATIYLTGLVTTNLPHAAATAVSLFLLGPALLRMLRRIQVKYGLGRYALDTP